MYSLRVEAFKFFLQFIDAALQVQIVAVVVGFQFIFGWVLALVELKCTVLELCGGRERERRMQMLIRLSDFNNTRKFRNL